MSHSGEYLNSIEKLPYSYKDDNRSVVTAIEWQAIEIDDSLSARICLGAASLNARQILLLGGNDSQGTDLKDAYVFDL